MFFSSSDSRFRATATASTAIPGPTNLSAGRIIGAQQAHELNSDEIRFRTVVAPEQNSWQRESVISIDKDSRDALSDQICDGLLKLIGSRLQARDQLPSVRQLALQSGVSVWTVNEAYHRLVARGVITSRPGLGYFVAPTTSVQRESNVAGTPYPKVRPVNSVSFVRNSMDPATHAVPVGTGFFPRAWMEHAIPSAVMGKVLKDPVMSMPAPAQGLLELRKQLSTKLAQAGSVGLPTASKVSVLVMFSLPVPASATTVCGTYLLAAL
ncbi:GntR family transcriptional regulator [Pseudorhodoferax sp. Leaf267]|uniref:GntR family transcriptional regulator n=1 Tax=Pseudorhodoferax sp. Leaf267 TaxID=1736316 RepID=UPI00138F8CA0